MLMFFLTKTMGPLWGIRSEHWLGPAMAFTMEAAFRFDGCTVIFLLSAFESCYCKTCFQILTIFLLVLNAGNFREWSTISINNHLSNPQQPIHALLSTSRDFSRETPWFLLPAYTEACGACLQVWTTQNTTTSAARQMVQFSTGYILQDPEGSQNPESSKSMVYIL